MTLTGSKFHDQCELALNVTPPDCNFWNKKVVNFRGFGVPTARLEGGKGEPALGGSGMAIFDLLGAGFLVIFFYHRGPGAVSSEPGIGEGITPK